MRFLVDANLPPALAIWITGQGHDAVASRDVLGQEASDAAIAALAADEQRVLITKDSDFMRLQTSFAFILVWLRVGNATNPALEQWLALRWLKIVSALEAGENFLEVR